MASHPVGASCTIGVKHEGDPKGKVVKVDDKYDAYVATPEPEKAHKDVALLYLPDVYGIWINSKLMADQFAANGYLCVVLDTFNGDPIPVNRPPDFDMQKWRSEGSSGNNPHTPATVDVIVEGAIKFIKEEYGATKVGALGYCFGAKYVIRHYKNGIDVGYLAHPSGVDKEELAKITGPLSIAAAETDKIFPPELRHLSEEVLEKTGQPYQMNLYSGVVHGFAVRGDPSKRMEKFAKEQAFFQAVHWFDEFLL